MDALHTFGLVMLALAVTLRWWRICVPVALALLLAWGISKVVSENTAWLSYALLLASLIGGGVWHLRSIRSAQDRGDGDLQKVHGDNAL